MHVIIVVDVAVRLAYLRSINSQEGLAHTINRKNILKDVIGLYRDSNIINEYPIVIKFVGEIGIDAGGIQRDMFSSFWTETYSELFEGQNILIPMIHPQTELSYLPIIGKIISHCYLISGILPVRIALPTLVKILLGPSSSCTAEMLLDSFLDYVSSVERSTLQRALSCRLTFPPELADKIMCTLSRFNCRMLPTPANMSNLILQIARYEFVTKPAAGIEMIHSGIPLCHKSFWEALSSQDIFKIYKNLTVSPEKVASLLSRSEFNSPQEERIYEYLRQMVENMKTEELSLFMRFVTGSLVCATDNISLQFNKVTGLGRIPVAHTCSCTLELSTEYLNYDDFTADFKAIFSQVNEEFT